MLLADLARLGVEQTELGVLLGEAMDQSSETWHDNAPVDAVNNQSRILARRAEGLISGLGSALLLDYPHPNDQAATIGSIVGVRYPGETSTDNLFLTGMCRTAPAFKDDAPFPTEFDVVTARSPLGEALLGLTIGGTALYNAPGHSLAVAVVNVQQLDPQYLVG